MVVLIFPMDENPENERVQSVEAIKVVSSGSC